MGEPGVSVLVAVYNGGGLLVPTIESALGQTFGDFELILVDDGSTDSSVEIIQGYRDPRIRLIRQANQGAAAALGTGLAAARAELVAFLDQDDVWRPEKLRAHVDRMRLAPEIDLTFSWFRYVDSRGESLGLSSTHYEGTIDFRGLFREFVIGATSNIVARRAAIERAGGFDARIPRLYDLDLCLRIARLAPHNIEAIPAELMDYRRHKAQMTTGFADLQQEWDRVAAKCSDLPASEIGWSRCNFNRYLARLAYENDAYGQALRYLADGYAASRGTFLADPRNWLTTAAAVSGAVLPRPLHKGLERLAGLRRE